MPDYVIYDPASQTVANRVTGYVRSWPKEREAELGANLIETPTMPGGVATSNLKVNGGVTVVEMSQGEKDAITVAEASAYIAATKANGKALFDQNQSDGRLFRALCETLLDELNILRAQVVGVGSVVWDPPSMANATGATSPNIAVAGAAFGDYVDVAAPYTLAGLTATAYVASAGQVNIRGHNGTGATLNLNSGTWTVVVRRHSAMPARTPAQARTSIQNKVDAQP